MGFPGGSLVKKKNSPSNTKAAGDVGSILGSGRPPGRGKGNPLSIFAGITTWTEGSGGLQSVVSQSQARLSISTPHTYTTYSHSLYLYSASYKLSALKHFTCVN